MDMWQNRKATEAKFCEAFVVVVKGLDIEPAIAP
jgi:hypothetical protein